MSRAAESGFDYVRRYYGVPAKRGMRVTVNGEGGTITRATHYVWIRLDGNPCCSPRGKKPRPYHPTDPAIVYPPSPEVPRE